MKKRLFSFLLATSLVILSVSPVFGTDTSEDEDLKKLAESFAESDPSIKTDIDYDISDGDSSGTGTNETSNAQKPKQVTEEEARKAEEKRQQQQGVQAPAYTNMTRTEDAKGAADYEQEKVDARKAMEEVFRELDKGASDIKIRSQVQAMSDVVTALASFGLSRPAIAGICANIWHESGFFPYAIQGMSTGANAIATPDLVYAPTSSSLFLMCEDRDITYGSGSISSEWLQTQRTNRKYSVNLNKNPGQVLGTNGGGEATGLGLVQFTDCTKDLDKGNLTNGLRGSQLVALGQSLSAADSTCIYQITDGETIVARNPTNDWKSADKVTATRTTMIYIPSATVQMGLLCCTLNENGTAGAGNLGFSGFQPKDGYSQTWGDYMQSTDPNFAVADFMYTVIRPNEVYAEERITDSNKVAQSEKIIQLVMDESINFTLNTTVATVGEAEAINYMTSLAKSGFFTEEQLSSFASLAESNIDRKLLSNAIRSNLDNQELEELANWERNVSSNSFENIIMGFARKTLMLFGILLEIWSLLVYLAYWFDRLNNIIPISLLSVLTFGKLRIADDVTEATYSIKDNSHKTSVKTVNHRAVLFIVVLGLSLGTLIVTGYIYVIIHWLVLKVHNLLK